MTIKKLLVATDLSDASYRALQCAAIHAKKFQSEIILLHIFEVADVDDSAKRMMASSFLNRDIKRQLQEMVEEVSKNEGIKATYLTKEGQLFDAMCEAARETQADMLYVGTHGVHGVQHLTGSFIAKTVNTNKVPVWIIQKDTALQAYKNLVVYIDEYPENPLNDITLDFAKNFETKVHFVFSEPENAFRVTDMIQKVKTSLDALNISYEFVFMADEADKQKALIDYAQSKEAPLLIIDRNNREVDMQVPLLTNKFHIEVLCLNTA